MTVDTVKQTQQDELLRVFALRYSQTIGKLGSGVAAFAINHNQGFVPAFKVFYQAKDKNNRKWFVFPNTFEGSVTDVTSMASHDPFLVSFSVSTTQFNFNCVNEDSVDHILNIVILLYANRGAG